MKNQQPLVSIVTPVYNGSKYLDELIVSVMEQQYSPIEHIIIDDGSTDNGATVSVLKRYPHLRWWSRPNKGQYPTMNEGLAAAKGELVTVICADDKYASRTAIASAVKVWSTNADCDAVNGETEYIGVDGRLVDMEGPRIGPLWLFRYYPVVSHCSLLLDREKMVSSGIWFDETLPYTGDYDWILRIIRAGFRFRRLSQPIASYRQHPHQRSNDENPSRVEEERRLRQMHGDLKPGVVFLVKKWVSLVRLRNLFRRRGIAACVQAITAHRHKV